MDEKILELLQEMQRDIKDLKVGQVETNNRLNTMQNDITDMQGNITDMQNDITEIKSDVKINRNTLDAVIKHTSKLVEDTTDIKKDLNKVEIVTSSNWTDIAKLKSIK
ncbi:hypothetical protein [Clostridioides sp. ZZV14-6150]|uniref:hypothetical protein n=1 Tax=Clostridioides sp. ZZV14-6150 TaxID=2811493 RepID=UPI001D12CD18